MEKLSLKIASKKIKHLGINLSKIVKDIDIALGKDIVIALGKREYMIKIYCITSL